MVFHRAVRWFLTHSGREVPIESLPDSFFIRLESLLIIGHGDYL